MILGIGVDVLHLPRLTSLITRLAVLTPPQAHQLASSSPAQDKDLKYDADETRVPQWINLGFDKLARRILSAEEWLEWERKKLGDVSWRATLGLNVEGFQERLKMEFQGTHSGPTRYLSTR